MTVIVRSSAEDVISIPQRLMSLLNLREGDQVKVVVEGDLLRLARLDNFLALEGILADKEIGEESLSGMMNVASLNTASARRAAKLHDQLLRTNNDIGIK